MVDLVPVDHDPFADAPAPTFTASDAFNSFANAWKQGSDDYAQQMGPDALSLKNLSQTWQNTPGLDAVQGFGPGGLGLAGTIVSAPLFHGTDQLGLNMLKASTRGPLGPGVYTTPAEQIAGMYRPAEGGTIYQLPEEPRDIFLGHGHRSDEEWFGFKNDKERLLAAAEPDKKEAVANILDKAWSNDGYPAYQQLRRLYGGHEGTQDLFRRAGFQGVSGLVDGPEVLLFGDQSLVPGIRAYHGSPHNFDQFDVSRVGTGEGAQAYGHGLYFAENEATAQSYRDALKTSRSKLPDDVISLPPEMRQAVTTHARTDADSMTAAKRAQYMSSLLRTVDQPKIADMIERVRDAERGRMYEVNIAAHPDQFLDWDTPLPMDHPIRQKIAESAQAALDRATTGANRNIAKDAFLSAQNENLTGQGAYQQLARTNTKPGVFPEINIAQPAQASDVLRQSGIPGIKYLDQGSRGSGAGTHNYVVFDDKLIKIIRKYGIAAMGAFPIGAQFLIPVDHDPFAEESNHGR